MMITTRSNVVADTDRDLSGPERQILKQLRLWKDHLGSVEEFRAKKARALAAGCQGSGPVEESRALSILALDLEEKLAQRLLAEKMGH
jgi:hypothetical protein